MDKIIEALRELGADDIGFSFIENPPAAGLNHAVTFVVRLSDAVIDQIDTAPTHAYFHHYRTVNAYIDSLVLRAGLLLQKNGYRYMPVAASQSINGYQGLFSHKTAARLAGLGSIGKNALFLHKTFGPRVRLGTLFTNAPLPCGEPLDHSLCSNCNLCVKACPAQALSGEEWHEGTMTVDAPACSDFMKKKYQHIGRGAVCGICVRVCPIHKL